MKEQLISVIIADRPYRLKVSTPEEEYTFRKAGKLIGDKMQEYASNFAFRDKQDLLAMVGLQLAVEMLNQQHVSESQEKLKKHLEDLDLTLDTILKK
jgi:cell division protein ZapA (FtsZ GTPase activity inhibitor)